MNMQALMQQAQKMQKDMTKKQNELASKEFTGTSELVDIKVKGDKKLVSVNIKVDGPIDSEDKEILQDMIVLAFNDAMNQVDKEQEKILGPYANQLGGLF